MSQIEFFMPPKMLFETIVKVSKKIDFKVIIHRFENNCQNGGFKILEFDDDMSAEYSKGKYSRIILSKGRTPQTIDDWSFYEDDADNLLEIYGCRVDEKYLELAKLRQITRKSKANDLYTLLKRELISRMKKGRLGTKGTAYPSIYLSDTASSFILTNNIIDKDFIYKQ